MRFAWSVALLLTAAATYAAQAPFLAADALVREGREAEARVAFDEWLAQNGDSPDLFAVLLRRLALDPNRDAVGHAVEAHGTNLKPAQLESLAMLPADFAELAGAAEAAAAELRASASASTPSRLRLRTIEAELGLASDAPDPAHPAAALYLVTEQHLVAGQSAAAQQSLAALVAAYPASPERFLAEARVALLSPASAEPLVPRPSVVRPYAAPSVLIGVAMADLSDDTRALATLPMVAGDALVSAATEPPAPLYAIQTGAYSDQENAEHVVGQLIQAGFPARAAAAAAAGSVAANVVRVLVGVHLVQDDADRLLADLRAAGYDGFLRAEA